MLVYTPFWNTTTNCNILLHGGKHSIFQNMAEKKAESVCVERSQIIYERNGYSFVDLDLDSILRTYPTYHTAKHTKTVHR
mmetsp:Transcript_23646/g.34390  ORF Transcript_23646/g.34390 Transcript_23646/m.34390 type:complete len:80 (+) Transcript_23646:274-513(+)